MKLIKTNNFTCVMASLAMVLDTEIKNIERMFPNCKKVINEDLPEPYCYQSVHPNEVVVTCMLLGKSCGFLEFKPEMVYGPLAVRCDWADQAVELAMTISPGLIFGTADGVGHCVAWDALSQQVYDPRGYTYHISNADKFSYKPMYFLAIR